MIAIGAVKRISMSLKSLHRETKKLGLARMIVMHLGAPKTASLHARVICTQIICSA